VARKGRAVYLSEVSEWQHNEAVDLFTDMGVQDGSAVVDFGCGQGRYTLPAAIAAGADGTVYAVDTSPTQIRRVAAAAKQEGLRNIVTVQASGDGTLGFVADESVDAVLIYDLIHQIGAIRSTFFAEVRRVLVPGGIFSVLPFHLSKAEKHGLIRDIEAAGFELSQIQHGVGLHFEMHEWLNGNTGALSQVERGDIYNFAKRA